MKIPRTHRSAGFTLPEMLVTVAILGLVGLMVFLVLNSGMVLYAKNTAVNSAHQQARVGVDQMLTNLHSAVSIPQLTDASLQPVPETDAFGQPVAAEGITFQTFNGGPFPVVVDAASTSSSIVLNCPGYVPPANGRLNIPSHNIELDIFSSNAIGSNRQFVFSKPIGTAIDIDQAGIDVVTGGDDDDDDGGGGAASYVITAFITTRRSYAVVGTELRYYPTNNQASYKVITRNIISPKPFTVPILPGGGLQNRYVAAVNLSTVEPNFTQRGYAAVNMFISSLIPFRSRLTNLQ